MPLDFRSTGKTATGKTEECDPVPSVVSVPGQ